MVLKLLNTVVQQCCHRDREAYFNQSCNETQEHAGCNEMSAVYEKIRQIAGDFKPRAREIKKDDHTVLWDSKGILDSWITYCEWR